MTSSGSASPPLGPPYPPPAGRSLISKLKAPFGAKTRNITDFHIQPDDPHRQYSPGDTVQGKVVVKVVKPVRITHIVVSLHGYVQVYKNPNTPGEGYLSHNRSIGTGKGKREGGYFGNGFASLFEDEVVLCGEGRLAEGTYEFAFELQFPSKGLPSSIDFERGTISYMITSTLTRPTSISPTMTCDARVYLIENIDIAPLYEPTPRVISLEPVTLSKRAKGKVSKHGAPSDSPSKNTDAHEPSQSRRVSESTSQTESPAAGSGSAAPPRSVAPSEISGDTRASSSGSGSGVDTGALSVKTGSGSLRASKAGSDKNAITATIELQKAGYLRGDTIRLKISISHKKPIKSLNGIIVTLYRQARVDMHPALPLVTNSKGAKIKSEDYYPKSKTGLGGLSLSGAGSSHVFRKDLSQSFAPLIIDPRTLTAEVSASVRVPDEAFPTISCVPGGMISFKYFVEVVVDLQGKLQGLDKFFSNAGTWKGPPTYGNLPTMSFAESGSGGMSAALGVNFVDTDPIRRDKNVVNCVFEVLVGTRDSERKGKRRQEPSAEAGPSLDDAQQADIYEGDLAPYLEPPQQDWPPYGSGTAQYDYYYEGYDPYAHVDTQHVDEQNPPHHYKDVPFRPPIPLPDLAAEEQNLSEKERLRRAEARLLPSQPPPADDDEAELSAATTSYAPSAPVIPEEFDYLLPQPPPPLHPRTHVGDLGRPSAPPVSPFVPRPGSRDEDDTGVVPGPSAPSYDSGAAGAGSHASDDKQELQRRRLEMERSAPDVDDPGGTGAEDAAGGRGDEFAPSAPVLSEEDEFGFGASGAEGQGLPRYER